MTRWFYLKKSHQSWYKNILTRKGKILVNFNWLVVIRQFILSGFILSFFTNSLVAEEPVDLTTLPLEVLINVEITSVSKKTEKQSHASAAISVITPDNIRRSGYTHLAEVLRLVPGMEVARVDANKWAVTSRGFNGIVANKLLVLVDKRSIYTPIFSGVFWEAQDLVFEDIEQIEVIRGPGATLWGSNAVNGVINIITKSAEDTQGGFLTVGGGTEERAFASLRYGGRLGKHLFYRVYSKYFQRDPLVDSTGAATADGWDSIQGGFRMDWDYSTNARFMLQGNTYQRQVGQTYRALTTISDPEVSYFDAEATVTGSNGLARWQHVFSSATDCALQCYYDYTARKSPLHDWNVNIVDLDFQNRFQFGSRQEIIWGIGYRWIEDQIKGDFPVQFNPRRRTTKVVNAFLQDNIQIINDKLAIILGSKFEHNDYTEFEIQPNFRFLWTLNKRHTCWLAISRAVKVPSRADRDIKFYMTKPPPEYLPSSRINAVIVLNGAQEFQSENLLAYEIGYRMVRNEWLSLDVAGFFNEYGSLRNGELGDLGFEAVPPPPHFVMPVTAGNNMYGETYGFELAITWELRQNWRVRAFYNYLKMDLRLKEGSNDIFLKYENPAGMSPRYQVALNSTTNLSKKITLDAGIYLKDRLKNLNVDHVINLVLRVGFIVNNNLELAIVGHNLLNQHDKEFDTILSETAAAEVERGVYGRINWKF